MPTAGRETLSPHVVRFFNDRIELYACRAAPAMPRQHPLRAHAFSSFQGRRPVLRAWSSVLPPDVIWRPTPPSRPPNHGHVHGSPDSPRACYVESNSPVGAPWARQSPRPPNCPRADVATTPRARAVHATTTTINGSDQRGQGPHPDRPARISEPQNVSRMTVRQLADILRAEGVADRSSMRVGGRQQVQRVGVGWSKFDRCSQPAGHGRWPPHRPPTTWPWPATPAARLTARPPPGGRPATTAAGRPTGAAHGLHGALLRRPF